MIRSIVAVTVLTAAALGFSATTSNAAPVAGVCGEVLFEGQLATRAKEGRIVGDDPAARQRLLTFTVVAPDEISWQVARLSGFITTAMTKPAQFDPDDAQFGKDLAILELWYTNNCR